MVHYIKGHTVIAKKCDMASLNPMKTTKMWLFFVLTWVWSLIKSKPIKLSRKFKIDIGSLAYYLPFLFNESCFKIKSLLTTAFILKAVKGGESALAMAKRRYTTVWWIYHEPFCWAEIFYDAEIGGRPERSCDTIHQATVFNYFLLLNQGIDVMMKLFFSKSLFIWVLACVFAKRVFHAPSWICINHHLDWIGLFPFE